MNRPFPARITARREEEEENDLTDDDDDVRDDRES